MFWTLCIIPQPQGCKNFPKIYKPPQNSRCPKDDTGFLHPRTSCNHSNFWFHTIYITMSAHMSPINVRRKPWWRPVKKKTCGRTHKVCVGIRTCACTCMNEMFFLGVCTCIHAWEKLCHAFVHAHTCVGEKEKFSVEYKIFICNNCAKYICIRGVSGSAVAWGTALQEKKFPDESVPNITTIHKYV